MSTISTAARIQREIAQQAGLNLLVDEQDGLLILTGIVDSMEAKQAAEDVARLAAPSFRIQNDLDVETELPVDVGDFQGGESIAEVAEDVGGDDGLEPDFTDQPLETVPSESDFGAEPMFAATDPVISVDEHGRAHVMGGFSTDSMASIDVELSADDTHPGDEALVEAVRRELKEDAATTSLNVDVFVRRGIVHLRGWVPGAEDVDNAEAVAERVPGVREVVDELELPAF